MDLEVPREPRDSLQEHLRDEPQQSFELPLESPRRPRSVVIVVTLVGRGGCRALPAGRDAPGAGAVGLFRRRRSWLDALRPSPDAPEWRAPSGVASGGAFLCVVSSKCGHPLSPSLAGRPKDTPRVCPPGPLHFLFAFSGLSQPSPLIGKPPTSPPRTLWPRALGLRKKRPLCATSRMHLRALRNRDGGNVGPCSPPRSQHPPLPALVLCPAPPAAPMSANRSH